MKLNAKQEELLKLVNCIPPDLDEIAKMIKENNFSSEDISIVGTAFVDNCFAEEIDDTDPENWILLEPHGPYVYQIVELLLAFGLDLNYILDGYNIMDELHFLETDYAAADTLQLLNDRGGDVNLEVDGETVFEVVDFDVIFDALAQENRRRYDALVHCWFVLLGNGGKLRDGDAGLQVFDVYDEKTRMRRPFDVSLLKNHRDYTFAITHTPARGTNWTFHIIDKYTRWEVARM